MIRLDKLSVGYGSHPLLSEVSTEVGAGRLIALIGRNGTGKSTLMRTLMGLVPPMSGTIYLAGEELCTMSARRRARTISLVNTELGRVEGLTAEAIVALGRAPYTDWLGRLDPHDHDAIAKAFEAVGIVDLRKRMTTTLSDGQCQRVMIARALAQEAPIILLDEPTAFLDLPGRYALCQTLRVLCHDEGRTIIFSTHELDIALAHCDDIWLIDTPHLHALPTSEMVHSGHLERLFATDSLRFDPKTLRLVPTEPRSSSVLEQ